MAESTTPTTPSTSSSSSSSSSQPASKQYIKASVDDNALEPDALRGSDQVKKDSGVQDDEEERRKIYKKDDK